MTAHDAHDTPAAAPPLPGFIAARLPFSRRLIRLERGPEAGRRLHLVDHGAPTALPVVLVHGNPTWSFLWRGVIARLDPGRLRAVAPDLLGFGLSDRLPTMSDHTLERHAEALAQLVELLGLERFVLCGQDWGGPLVAQLGARFPERVVGLVLGNTSVLAPKRPRGTWFHRFARVPVISDLAFRTLNLPVRTLALVQGERRSISGEVARAYVWPFERPEERIGPLALARMVPDSETHPSMAPLRRGEAWVRAFHDGGGPVRLVWGERDPILGKALGRHEKALPRAQIVRTRAGHFLQEEVPDVLAEAITDIADGALASDGKARV